MAVTGGGKSSSKSHFLIFGLVFAVAAVAALMTSSIADAQEVAAEESVAVEEVAEAEAEAEAEVAMATEHPVPVQCIGIVCGWPACPDGADPVLIGGDCCPSCPEPDVPVAVEDEEPSSIDAAAAEPAAAATPAAVPVDAAAEEPVASVAPVVDAEPAAAATDAPAAPAEPDVLVAVPEDDGPASVMEPDANDVVVAFDTYVVPESPIMQHVVPIGDALSLVCYANNEAYKDYPPVLKYRPSAKADYNMIYIGATVRPGVPAAISDTIEVVQNGHLWYYNFHSASMGMAGEYECDYTHNEEDVTYHVVVVDSETIMCPKAGIYEEETTIHSAACSIASAGFFPDDRSPEPVIRLMGEDLQNTEVFFDDGRLHVVAKDLFMSRPLNDARYACVFPVTSNVAGVGCESEPLVVTWNSKGLKLKAPTSIVYNVTANVACEVEELGNPPTAIDLYVLGRQEDKGTKTKNVATLDYVETRESLRLIEFVCRSEHEELTATADVHFGPDKVDSFSSGRAVMLENTQFEWACMSAPSNPPAVVEYWVCGDPEDDDTCERQVDNKDMIAVRRWQHKYLKCTATNPATSHRAESSPPHKIDVQHTPVYQGKKKDRVIQVRKGEPFTIKCEHESNPEEMTYAWRKEAVDLEDEAFLSRKRREEHSHQGDMDEHDDDDVVVETAVVVDAAAVVVDEDAHGEEEEEEHGGHMLEHHHEHGGDDEHAGHGDESSVAAEEEGTDAVIFDSEESEEAVFDVEPDLPGEEADADAPVAVPAETAEPAEPAAEPAEPEPTAEVGEEPKEPVDSNDIDGNDDEPMPLGKSDADAEADAASVMPFLVLTEEPPSTARPLIPSIDLSKHTDHFFDVAFADNKHFGTYRCRVNNSVGVNEVLFQVKQDTTPKFIPKPPKPSGGNSASFIQTPFSVLIATLLTCFIFLNH